MECKFQREYSRSPGRCQNLSATGKCGFGMPCPLRLSGRCRFALALWWRTQSAFDEALHSFRRSVLHGSRKLDCLPDFLLAKPNLGCLPQMVAQSGLAIAGIRRADQYQFARFFVHLDAPLKDYSDLSSFPAEDPVHTRGSRSLRDTTDEGSAVARRTLTTCRW